MSITPSENSEGKYKWYILTLASLTAVFVFAMPMMCMPVLFKEIAEELNLSLVQLGVVWGIIPLAGAFVVLFGGMLSDRFGAKRILIAGCLLTSLAGILRGVSNDFTVLTLTMFLFGLLMTITAPSMLKALSTWFSREKLALANGILSMAFAVGFMVGSMISATVLSPALGGWRNVLYFYGIFGILCSILWGFTRSMPGGNIQTAERATVIPFKQALSHVFRIKRVWLLALITMGQISCIQGTLGYLPYYLKDIGWTPASADGTLTLFHAASMIGAVPMTLLSNRFRSRTVVIFIGTLVTAIGVGMLAISGGPMVWAAVLIAGIVRDGFMAVSSTMIIETDGIGMIYAGTAIGLGHTVNRIGEFISPPIGNSFGNINPRFPFIFWSALVTATTGVYYFLREKSSDRLRTP